MENKRHAGGRPPARRTTKRLYSVRRNADTDARLERLMQRTGKDASTLFREGLAALEYALNNPDLVGLPTAARRVLEDLRRAGIETAHSNALRRLVGEEDK